MRGTVLRRMLGAEPKRRKTLTSLAHWLSLHASKPLWCCGSHTDSVAHSGGAQQRERLLLCQNQAASAGTCCLILVVAPKADMGPGEKLTLRGPRLRSGKTVALACMGGWWVDRRQLPGEGGHALGVGLIALGRALMRALLRGGLRQGRCGGRAAEHVGGKGPRQRCARRPGPYACSPQRAQP